MTEDRVIQVGPEFIDTDVRIGESYPCRIRVPLQRALIDWTDWDVAMFELGRLLGVFGYNDSWEEFRTTLKGVFWSDNPLNRHLTCMLRHLVKIGMLEYDKEEQRFRCRQGYDWKKVPPVPDVKTVSEMLELRNAVMDVLGPNPAVRDPAKCIEAGMLAALDWVLGEKTEFSEIAEEALKALKAVKNG